MRVAQHVADVSLSVQRPMRDGQGDDRTRRDDAAKLPHVSEGLQRNREDDAPTAPVRARVMWVTGV